MPTTVSRLHKLILTPMFDAWVVDLYASMLVLPLCAQLELHSSSWDAWVVKQKELSGLSVDEMNADGRWKQYGIDHVNNPPPSPPSRAESTSL